MLAHYGIDTLADPGPTPRRMHRLVQALPAGAFPGMDVPMAWSTEAHLLAAVIDAVEMLTWVQVSKASRTRPKKPKPFPRPGTRTRIRPIDLAEALTGMEGVRIR